MAAKGEVMLGAMPMSAPALDHDYQQLMTWVDRRARCKVRTNADTPIDAKTARNFGAEGIGLCRTEHMFFAEDKILAVREMILADKVDERRRALEKILPMQRADFEGIFREMDGLPVTIRLLDPPLHEFLPTEQAQMEVVARELGVSDEAIRARNEALHESNPMLGHRGCRLAMTFPEIYETQARAIVEAAVRGEAGRRRRAARDHDPDRRARAKSSTIMRELVVRHRRARAAEQRACRWHYTVGTMIELPRACLVADKIAATRTSSRSAPTTSRRRRSGSRATTPRASSANTCDSGVYAVDPVRRHRSARAWGSSSASASRRAARQKPSLKIGICGEHGGEPSSIEFCHMQGLDYVSCSPFRVPIARLAAAQAALVHPR